MLARMFQLENKISAVGEPSYRWNYYYLLLLNSQYIDEIIVLFYIVGHLCWSNQAFLLFFSPSFSILLCSGGIYRARRSRIKRVQESLQNSLRGRIELIDSYARVRFL